MSDFSNRPGPAHGLPREFDGAIESWGAAVSLLEVLAASERPVVVQVGGRAGRATAELRGLLQSPPYQHRSPSVEVWLVISFTVESPPGRGRSIVPIMPRESGGPEGFNYIELDGSLFESGTLRTADGDDYFWLTLNMGDLVVRVMDTNAH